MDYRIVCTCETNEDIAKRKMEADVERFLKMGWKPLGGVSVSRSDTVGFQKVVMAQAMIKE